MRQPERNPTSTRLERALAECTREYAECLMRARQAEWVGDSAAVREHENVARAVLVRYRTLQGRIGGNPLRPVA